MAEPVNPKEFTDAMINIAARACVKSGMRRQLATLEFMAAFDRAAERERIDMRGPVAVVRELEPGDFTDGKGTE